MPTDPISRIKSARTNEPAGYIINGTDTIRSYKSARTWLLFLALLFSAGAGAQRPNIVYILADDLGYGDISIYNTEGKISTPNIDRLARNGMRFTDAHTASAVCTPSRYAILTGRYPWRTVYPLAYYGAIAGRL